MNIVEVQPSPTSVQEATVLPAKQLNYTTTSSSITIANRDQVDDAYFYSMAIIIPIGLFCNLFCLFIFTMSPAMRRSSTGHYLTALAIADAAFLVGDTIRWMNLDERYLGVRFLHTSAGACMVTHWLRYAAKLISAWITVAIVTERLITVAVPLRVSIISTSSRAKIVIVVIFLLGMGLGSFPLWTLEVDETLIRGQMVLRCLVRESSSYELWNTAILRVGTLVLPWLLISVATFAIIYHLVKASRRRLKRMEGQTGMSLSAIQFVRGRTEVAASLAQRNDSSVRVRPSTEAQLTAMLVAVCLAFVCFRLPYTIAYYTYENGKSFWRKDHPLIMFRALLALRITDIVATANYAVNFFLYCLCGTYFRQQVRIVCRGEEKFGGVAAQRNRQISLPEVSSYSTKWRTSLHVMTTSQIAKPSML